MKDESSGAIHCAETKETLRVTFGRGAMICAE